MKSDTPSILLSTSGAILFAVGWWLLLSPEAAVELFRNPFIGDRANRLLIKATGVGFIVIGPIFFVVGAGPISG
jgi:hypothetical protein